MPSFPTLSRSDLQAVIAHTDRLQPPATASPTHPDDVKVLYTTNCANCHGLDGSGDGIAAAPLARPPTSFRLRQPNAAQAFRVISEGVPGTAMAGWKTKLSEAQRKMLAEYVRGFYIEPTGNSRTAIPLR
jgi:mono/diheme cytochrome c family protein